MKKKHRILSGAPALAVIALLAAAAFLALSSRSEEQAEARESASVRVDPRPPRRVQVGDAKHGRDLYITHCSSCHGVEGDGTGPAADYLWPLPRDHRDAAYMLSRTDDQLFKAVSHGGRGVSRSYLMPAWNTVFDKYQTWNLVAYLKSLVPELPAGVTRARFHQVLLSEERHGKIAALSLPRLAGFIRCLEAAPEDEESEEEPEETLRSLMIFPRIPVGGRTTTLALRYAPDGRLVEARTLERIRLPDLPDDAVDRLLDRLVAGDEAAERLPQGPDFAAMIRAARRLMRLVLDQEKEDTKAAEVAYRKFTEKPESLSRGERLYMQNCGACHGFTGRVVGPLAVERDSWPRALADGWVMSRLSDDYIKSLVRKGGLHWNLSGAMPASPSLKDEEIDALVAHVRSLSDPRGDGKCPCGSLRMACAGAHAEGACLCCERGIAGHKCSHMKR